MASQSAWTAPRPLFTIFLKAIISQTAAILDTWISSNSFMSHCGTWKEGCGGDEGEQWDISADRRPVQHTDRALNSDHLNGFGHGLHTSLTAFTVVSQNTRNHINKLTQTWPLHGCFLKRLKVKQMFSETAFCRTSCCKPLHLVAKISNQVNPPPRRLFKHHPQLVKWLIQMAPLACSEFICIEASHVFKLSTPSTWNLVGMFPHDLSPLYKKAKPTFKLNTT